MAGNSMSARALVAAIVVTALVGFAAWLTRSGARDQSGRTPNPQLPEVTALAATGSLTCSLSGHASFAPALQHANATGSRGPTSFTLQGALTSCNNSGIDAGAVPVVKGSVAVSGTIDSGASCADLLSGPEDITLDPNTLIVKLLRKRAGTTAFTTTLHTDVSDDSLTDPAGYDLTGWTYTSDPLSSVAFNGETVTLELRVDNFLSLGGCVAGRIDLPSVSFSAAGKSLFSIAP
jgi:hypothetical protein